MTSVPKTTGVTAGAKSLSGAFRRPRTLMTERAVHFSPAALRQSALVQRFGGRIGAFPGIFGENIAELLGPGGGLLAHWYRPVAMFSSTFTSDGQAQPACQPTCSNDARQRNLSPRVTSRLG